MRVPPTQPKRGTMSVKNRKSHLAKMRSISPKAASTKPIYKPWTVKDIIRGHRIAECDKVKPDEV